MAIVKRIASEEYADEKALYEANEAVKNIPQSDWNQNDESAPDFIKNKPFYEDIITSSMVLVDEDINLEVAPDIMPFGDFSEPIALENGKSYTVTINDVKQEIVCENDKLILSIGAVIGSFGINNVQDDILEGGWSCHVKIETAEVSTIVKQLDEKFIPDTIARIEDVNAPKTEFILNSSTEGSTKKFKLTIDDAGVLTAMEIVESTT